MKMRTRLRGAKTETTNDLHVMHDISIRPPAISSGLGVHLRSVKRYFVGQQLSGSVSILVGSFSVSHSQALLMLGNTNAHNSLDTSAKLEALGP